MSSKCDRKKAVAKRSVTELKETGTGGCQAARDLQRLLGPTEMTEGRRDQARGKSSPMSPCSSDEQGWSQTSDASRQGGSVDTSPEKPSRQRLGSPISARFYLPVPQPPELRQGGPRRPEAPALPGKTQRRRPRRHSPHGHAAPAPGRPYDERVPGGRQAALRGAGSRGRGRQL